MSTGLFASKQAKSSRNLKKLTISSPIARSSSSSLQASPVFSPVSGDPVIVLRVKYDFDAESSVEMSVRQNDFVKLVHRPGNGWLLVKYIDKTGSGLIPASYVEIIANDLQKPVSAQWLLESSPSTTSKQDSISNIRITTVLQNKKLRYLYRMDISMGSGKQVYLCKYYQDFYNLYVSLVASLGRVVTIPYLPNPQRSLEKSVSASSLSNDNIKDLLQLAAQLSKYMRELLAINEVRNCDEFVEFINDEQFKRIEVNPGDLPLPDSEINNLLHKDSINILDTMQRADCPPSISSTPSQSPRNTGESPRLRQRTSPAQVQLRHLKASQSTIAIMSSFTASASNENMQKRSNEEPSPMVESKSSQTLSTFSSLLAGYGEEDAHQNKESKEEEFDFFNERTISSESKSEGTQSMSDTTLQEPVNLDTRSRSPVSANYHPKAGSSDMSYESVSTIGSQGVQHTHYSSGEDSIMSNSSRHKSSSCEPKTPTMVSEHSFSRCPPRLFGGEDDEQIKPLSPKKHKEAYITASSSTTTITPDAEKKTTFNGEYVKIKVTLCNEDDDKVILRVRRNELHSIDTLKHMLSFKIYKDPALIHHYTLQPMGEPRDENALDEGSLLNYVRSSTKAHLRLQRAR
ncbi:hypothetical protein B9J08_02552 [Candidozyma auris]|uniref:SH3 domain-containing protein n=1 Tax=Candidozyma auris TaxID=498019 RepID=A0A2H1A5B4_CANAR|nr:hypothetical protein B9J08_000594 [[Candida] auris]